MDTIISFDINDLQEVSIYDATTFTSPDNISDINGVRMLFETVNSVREPQTATECLAWFQYEVLTGTATANGIDYAVGDTMLFAVDTTPTGTYTMQTTGVYGQYISDSLPKSGLGYVFTPDQVGRTAVDSVYFADEVYTMTYEYYTTIYTDQSSLNAGTYLCVGTIGDSVLIDGTKEVFVGETYVSSGSETFAGTPTMVLFSESSQYVFATQYETFQVYKDYLSAKATAIPPSSVLDSNLLSVSSLYATPTISAQTESGISLTDIQNNLDRILSYYANQLGNV